MFAVKIVFILVLILFDSLHVYYKDKIIFCANLIYFYN